MSNNRTYSKPLVIATEKKQYTEAGAVSIEDLDSSLREKIGDGDVSGKEALSQAKRLAAEAKKMYQSMEDIQHAVPDCKLGRVFSRNGYLADRDPITPYSPKEKIWCSVGAMEATAAGGSTIFESYDEENDAYIFSTQDWYSENELTGGHIGLHVTGGSHVVTRTYVPTSNTATSENKISITFSERPSIFDDYPSEKPYLSDMSEYLGIKADNVDQHILNEIQFIESQLHLREPGSGIPLVISKYLHGQQDFEMQKLNVVSVRYQNMPWIEGDIEVSRRTAVFKCDGEKTFDLIRGIPLYAYSQFPVFRSYAYGVMAIRRNTLNYDNTRALPLYNMLITEGQAIIPPMFEGVTQFGAKNFSVLDHFNSIEWSCNGNDIILKEQRKASQIRSGSQDIFGLTTSYYVKNNSSKYVKVHYKHRILGGDSLESYTDRIFPDDTSYIGGASFPSDYAFTDMLEDNEIGI